MKQIILCTLMAAAFADLNAQELKLPAPSPTTHVKQDFSTSFIQLDYSRPLMRGREIFGGLVPYGQVWRTGANNATKITFGEDVNFGGQEIKKGAYALYTVPGEKEWKIILNTGVSNWGVSGFDEKDDVATFTVPVQKTEAPVQSFTIAIEEIDKNSCDVTLSWENTRVVIPVKADNFDRIKAYLEKELKGDKPPYHQAAAFYLDNNVNLPQAAEYAQKAIDAQPKAFYLHWLKARIYDKMGKKEEAIQEAKAAADGAKNTPYAAEYQKHYNDLKAGK